MENTVKAGLAGITKIKIVQILATMVFCFVLCRGPVMGESFIIGVSYIAYMLSKDAKNIYLVIPAAVGLLMHVPRGYEPWGYIAAMVVCGFAFVAAKGCRFKMWQRSLIAAAITITCVSVCSFATGTVYKLGVAKLLLEGFLTAALVFVFEGFYCGIQRTGRQSISEQKVSRQLSLASFMVVCLMVVNGTELSFVVWMTVIFAALWALVVFDTETSLLLAVSGSVAAALMEESRWGIMATIMIGLFIAGFAKKYGAMAAVAVFVAVCWLLGYVESGVILGADKYCLLLPAAAFAVIYLRFSGGMKRAMLRFAGERTSAEELFEKKADLVLKTKESEMNSLSELYSTYMDGRAMLANQFDIDKEILEDARVQLGRISRTVESRDWERSKFQIKVAVSQCAATGDINGDCCGWQEIGEQKVALVVSDGMGKGKKAAAESLMVTRTVISLLKSGVSADRALKLINGIMLIKEDEDSYATLDMVILDRRTGKARFYKIGAAPTLVRRKDEVREVQVAEVPLGIVNGIKVRYVEMAIKQGDWIIMMSDGVSDGGGRRSDDGKFLGYIKGVAANVRSEDPQVMCDVILNRAADSYLGRERDDLSVMVARIL